MIEVFVSQVHGPVIGLVLAILFILKQFYNMQSKLYVSGLSLNLLRQTKPIFLSLICMQRNWSSNGLEAAQDERTGDEWSVYRQVQDFRERGSGLRARHLAW